MTTKTAHNTFLVSVVVLFVMGFGPASADDRVWINPNGGTFSTESNWKDGLIPGATDNAIFSLGTQGYTVALTEGAASRQLIVFEDSVTLDLTGFAYLINAAGAVDDQMIGLPSWNAQNAVTSYLTITNGTVSGAGRIYVGSPFGAAGALSLSNGASVTASTLQVASQVGVSTCTISGAASTLLTTGPEGSIGILAGGVGAGSLTISDGGSVTANTGLLIGVASPGLAGTLTVQDAGSVLTVGGIGVAVGTGVPNPLNASQRLFVENGGRVIIDGNSTFAPSTSVATHGNVVISGSGSELDASESLLSAADGGMLRVENGGSLLSAQNITGSFNANFGPVRIGTSEPPGLTVTGSGSSWHSGGTIRVGANGYSGAIMIADGATAQATATASTTEVLIGEFAIGTASGKVSVLGAGTMWLLQQMFVSVGSQNIPGGDGQLLIGDGAEMHMDGGAVQVHHNGILDVGAGSVLSSPFVIVLTEFSEPGVLSGNGTIDMVGGAFLVNEGLITPGGQNTGLLTINGNFSQHGGSGILAIDIGGLTPGLQFDQLVVNGLAGIGGMLRLKASNGFTPFAGQTFEVVKAGQIQGQFALECDDSIFSLSYTPTSVIVTVGSGVITDCNHNGNSDLCDIANCESDPACLDQNGNGIPDGCDIANCMDNPACDDCNMNGILDGIEIANCNGDPTCEDCNLNGVPDGCEPDCNSNGVPDSCDIEDCVNDPACADCNLNGVPDDCDILSGFSVDANIDQIPDECIGFTGNCTTMGAENNWTCGENWSLGGQYPDNADSAAGIAVTLPSGSSVLLDETVVIPSLTIESGAKLLVTQGSGSSVAQVGTDGDLLFSAPATLRIDGSLFVAGPRAVGLGGPQLPTVTIGPDGIYSAEAVAGADTTATLGAQSVRVLGADCSSPPCSDGGSMDLSESMTATVTGDVTIDGGRTMGAVCGSVAGGYTPPAIRIRKDGILDCADFSMLGAAYLVVDPTTPMTTPLSVGGDFNNQSTRPDCFVARNGGILLNGTSVQAFEVAGTDIGPAGSVDGTEFVVGAVEVAPGSQVTFRNDFDNNGLGQAPCEEALYVERLTLGADSSVVVDNCRVYYETLDQDPSATISSIGCGELHFISAPLSPGADPTGISKGRAVSFVPPGGSNVAGIGDSAFRVVLDSLHHVDPPYTAGSSIPFSSFEGQVRWVGPPTQYVESVSSGTPFYASQLQCEPYYQDWSTVGLLHLFGSAIVPSSVYAVENLAGSCMGNESNCAAISAPLSVSTGRWGDVVDPFNPPSTTSQPDFGDIGALVNKFKSAPGAPIKARALLAGTNANGEIDPTPDVGFTHISACVDAFKGFPYPYTIASCP